VLCEKTRRTKERTGAALVGVGKVERRGRHITADTWHVYVSTRGVHQKKEWRKAGGVTAVLRRRENELKKEGGKKALFLAKPFCSSTGRSELGGGRVKGRTSRVSGTSKETSNMDCSCLHELRKNTYIKNLDAENRRENMGEQPHRAVIRAKESLFSLPHYSGRKKRMPDFYNKRSTGGGVNTSGRMEGEAPIMVPAPVFLPGGRARQSEEVTPKKKESIMALGPRVIEAEKIGVERGKRISMSSELRVRGTVIWGDGDGATPGGGGGKLGMPMYVCLPGWVMELNNPKEGSARRAKKEK